MTNAIIAVLLENYAARLETALEAAQSEIEPVRARGLLGSDIYTWPALRAAYDLLETLRNDAELLKQAALSPAPPAAQ